MKISRFLTMLSLQVFSIVHPRTDMILVQLALGRATESGCDLAGPKTKRPPGQPGSPPARKAGVIEPCPQYICPTFEKKGSMVSKKRTPMTHKQILANFFGEFLAAKLQG